MEQKIIKEKERKFIGMYVSVWFNSKVHRLCQEKDSTVSEDAPKYNLPLVFNKYLSVSDVMTYLTENLFVDGIEYAKWRKSIHVKYIYNVTDEYTGKTYEVFEEVNYNGETNTWSPICRFDNTKSQEYTIQTTLQLYKYLPLRIVGSWFTMRFFFVNSQSKYQYLLIKQNSMVE